MLLHCALCINLKHQAVPEIVPNNQEQEYRATGTDDCYRNCTPTLHETVQNSANACEVHGRNNAPNKNINPAVMRGYASKCDALPKAGEAIRTPDIHVGNVTLYHWATPAKVLLEQQSSTTEDEKFTKNQKPAGGVLIAW